MTTLHRVWSAVSVLSLVCGLALTESNAYGQKTDEEIIAKAELFEARTVPSFPKPGAVEAKILQSLSDPVDVNWNDKPLNEVLNDLEEMHGVEIWIDLHSIRAQGVPMDQQITLQLKGTSLRACLKLILEPLGLVYVVEDQVMKITSASTLETKLVTRIYPVADLCATVDEAKQLLETLECGLGRPRDSETPRLVVSAKMKTLTVRDSYVNQERVQELILALRDAQTANLSLQHNIKPEEELKPEQPLLKPRPI